MYEQILKNKNGKTVKILSHHQGIYIISLPDKYTQAGYENYTKQDLINRGWIFPVWTPELGKEYYIPSPFVRDRYGRKLWLNEEDDSLLLSLNFVCRTPEEAIALTDKMLGAVK